jgi:hypothetical protein
MKIESRTFDFHGDLVARRLAIKVAKIPAEVALSRWKT